MKKVTNYTFLLIFLVTIFSCEEEINNQENLSKHWKVNDVTKRDLSKKTNFLYFIKKLDEAKDYSAKNNLVNNTYNFYIDYSTIREIELETKTSYTFSIYRDSTSNDSFENLVVIVENEEIIKAYTLKYTPTEDILYVKEHNTTTFEGNVGVTEVDLEYLNIDLQRGPVCTEVNVAYCSYLGFHLAGPECFMWNIIKMDGRI